MPPKKRGTRGKKAAASDADDVEVVAPETKKKNTRRRVKAEVPAEPEVCVEDLIRRGAALHDVVDPACNEIMNTIAGSLKQKFDFLYEFKENIKQLCCEAGGERAVPKTPRNAFTSIQRTVAMFEMHGYGRIVKEELESGDAPAERSGPIVNPTLNFDDAEEDGDVFAVQPTRNDEPAEDEDGHGDDAAVVPKENDSPLPSPATALLPRTPVEDVVIKEEVASREATPRSARPRLAPAPTSAALTPPAALRSRQDASPPQRSNLRSAARYNVVPAVSTSRANIQPNGTNLQRETLATSTPYRMPDHSAVPRTQSSTAVSTPSRKQNLRPSVSPPPARPTVPVAKPRTRPGISPARVPIKGPTSSEQRREKDAKLKAMEERNKVAEQNREEQLREKKERLRKQGEEKAQKVRLNQEKQRLEMERRLQKQREEAERAEEMHRRQQMQQMASPSRNRLGTGLAGLGTPVRMGIQRQMPLLNADREKSVKKRLIQSPCTPRVTSKIFRVGSASRDQQPSLTSSMEDSSELDAAEQARRAVQKQEEERKKRKAEAAAREETIRKEEERREQLRMEAKKREEERRRKLEMEHEEKERKEREEAERKRRKEEEARRRREEEEKQRREREEEARKQQLQQATKKPSKTPLVNRHLNNVSNINSSSYDMTPEKIPIPSTETNYVVDDLSSGDETDEEDNPKKRVPKWAQPDELRKALRRQRENPPFDPDTFFGPVLEPDVAMIFGASDHHKKRTSSAMWNSPLSNPTKGKSRFLGRH